jgi:hypothetical protein
LVSSHKLSVQRQLHGVTDWVFARAGAGCR